MTTKMTLRKSKDDDLMLDKLKLVTGIKTKAPALLKVGYSYLELLKKYDTLENKYNDSLVDNKKLKNAIIKRNEYSSQLKKQEQYLNKLLK